MGSILKGKIEVAGARSTGADLEASYEIDETGGKARVLVLGRATVEEFKTDSPEAAADFAKLRGILGWSRREDVCLSPPVIVQLAPSRFGT